MDFLMSCCVFFNSLRSQHDFKNQFLKGNHSKKPARKIFSAIEFWISRVIFPRARGKIEREIQISMALKIFLAGFLYWFPFSPIKLRNRPFHYNINAIANPPVSPWCRSGNLFRRRYTCNYLQYHQDCVGPIHFQKWEYWNNWMMEWWRHTEILNCMCPALRIKS